MKILKSKAIYIQPEAKLAVYEQLQARGCNSFAEQPHVTENGMTCTMVFGYIVKR